MAKTRRVSGKRVIIIQVLMGLWVLAIGIKLVYLQVKESDWLSARAEQQQQFEIGLSPTRGIIYDRNGNELARSAEVKSLYASPSAIKDKDPAGIATRLAKLLDIDRDELYKRLTSTRVLVAVKRKLTDQEVARVESLDLPGLSFINEMKRFYIAGGTAAHVVGFVDYDETGVSGIEKVYDKLIRGQAGRLQLNVDALKNSYSHHIEESLPGANITLTIDTMVQHYVEKALLSAIHSSRARGGTVVVMRPATGEILALASYPTFNPNDVSDSDEIERRNRAVEVAFEPGSMFKLVTYSAAIEEGLVEPNSMINCNGEVRVGDRVVREKPYGLITATKALAKSSNVAAIKLGQMLGKERLARYIEAFGFGQRTGIELPAESRGLLREASAWHPTSITSIPMGYEVAVTALQTVGAFACIANGGEWVRPFIVNKISSSSGETVEEHIPETRRVVSEATATRLKGMLESVVINGTAKLAQVSGYRAAGKTGTSQKLDEATKRYSSLRHIASFAGFAPVDNPEIACIVSLDEPRGAYHGGEVAAPVFARVVADTLQILGVPPEDDPQSSLVAGDFKAFSVPRALKESFAAAAEGDSRPAIDVATDAIGPEAASKPGGSVVVPNLGGRGIREAIALCAGLGLKIKASGDGVVANQSPPPGSLVTEGTVCHLKLSKQVNGGIPVNEDGKEKRRFTAKAAVQTRRGR